MKSFSVWLSALAVVVSTPALATGSRFVEEAPVPLSKAFLPNGFDTDDSVEIVVTGHFPNTCYKMGPIETRVNSELVILLRPVAYQFSGKCVEGPIPFSQVLHLGRLREAGVYRVVDETTKQTLGKLRIKPAPDTGHGTDEILYAPLTDAYLLQGNNKQVIRLVGAFPDSCFAFKKITGIPSSDVVVVLPEVTRQNRNDCEKGHFPFEEEWEVDFELPHEAFLLHVRSMSGQAINKLVVSHP